MFKGFIYKITNKIDNKIYIGQTRVSVEKRFLDHLKCSQDLKYNSHLYEAIRKYGKENFYVETIEVIETNLNDLYNREKYWIAFYNSTNQTIGYNIDEGGRGGDIIHLLPLERQEERKQKIRKYNLGKKQSEETIKKRVEKNKGRKEIYKDGKILRVYPEQLEEYISQGWILGKMPELTLKSTVWHKDEEKKRNSALKISQKTKGRSKGWVRLYKGDDRVFISPDQIEKYINLGYIRGQGISGSCKNKVMAKNKETNVNKFIYLEEIENYIKLGWEISKGGLEKYEKNKLKCC